MSLEGKRIAVMVDQQYQELEVWYPTYRFAEAGAEVVLVGPAAKVSYASKLGYPCESHIAAADVNGSHFDAVIVPGGWAPDYMRRDATMVGFLQQAVDADKVIAAICHGGWMLCSTGAARGKRATCFMAIKDDLINAGAEYVDEEVVVDGNLITSRKPDDLPEFCRAVIAALGQRKK
ncbi:MAG: type 1 glutamine amidotransferase domain-containing protein [Planctomycetota bacterium]|jgi:protease I